MAESRRAVDLGCYFSINAEMFKSPRHRAIIAALPLERLLTETDGPFTESEGRPSRPRDVTLIVRDLASVRNLEVGEIGQKNHLKFGVAGFNAALIKMAKYSNLQEQNLAI